MDAFKKKNGKENDIKQKGGRGSSLNHAFELLRKNDKLQRRGGVPLVSCHRKILEKRQIFQFLGKKRALSELRFKIYWHSLSYFLDFPNVIPLKFADKD